MLRHGLNGIVREAAGRLWGRVRTRRRFCSMGVRDITAVVAANDLLALGERARTAVSAGHLTRRAQRHAADGPVSPLLTTVRIEHGEVGRIAAKMLIDTIKSRSAEIRHVVLRFGRARCLKIDRIQSGRGTRLKSLRTANRHRGQMMNSCASFVSADTVLHGLFWLKW